MKESIKEMVKNLKDMGELLRTLIEVSYEVARKFLQVALEKLEEYLNKVRNKELKVEHIRKRWIGTLLGDVRIKRRQYRDKEGKSNYLLDEFLGLSKGSPLLPDVKESALFLASLLPFRKCAEALEKSQGKGERKDRAIHRISKREFRRSQGL